MAPPLSPALLKKDTLDEVKSPTTAKVDPLLFINKMAPLNVASIPLRYTAPIPI